MTNMGFLCLEFCPNEVSAHRIGDRGYILETAYRTRAIAMSYCASQYGGKLARFDNQEVLEEFMHERKQSSTVLLMGSFTPRAASSPGCELQNKTK